MATLPQPPGVPLAPSLSEPVLKAELERMFHKERRSCVVAFFGSGVDQEIDVNGQRFEVVPTCSELDLRARLARGSGTGARVYLVDWTQELPLDIACRVASGRLRRIARDTRIATLFGARDVAPELLGSALASAVLGEPDLASRIPPISGQVLTAEDAYERYLFALAEVPMGLVTPQLIAWFARDASGGAVLRERFGMPSYGERLGEEVREFVRRRYGYFGQAALESWVASRPGAMIGYAVLLAELAPRWGKGDYAEGALESSLRGLVFGDALLKGRSELNGELLDSVLDELGWGLADLESTGSYIIVADQFQKALEDGRLVPHGLRGRRTRFVEAIRALVEKPGRAGLNEAARTEAAVAAHRLAREDVADQTTRTMMLRLGAFLVEDACRSPSPAGGAEYQAAVDLAVRYAAEGGFIDWARRHLRPIREEPYAGAVGELLTKADACRREMDETFARGMVAWVEHGQPATQVVPIAECARRLGHDLLGEADHRRLLVILMDGMSHTDAAQLMASAAERGERWAPVRWRPKEFRHLDVGLFPPVIAGFPTLTSVSRAAFFAGKHDPTAGNKNTSNDRNRWAKHRHINKLFEPSETPRLLLKDELEHQGGLSETARTLIKDEDTRVLAVVVNAIDDQLASGRQVQVEYSLERIPILRDLLIEAEGAERAVLLTSDHGHVHGARFRSLGNMMENAGHRWRPLKSGEQPESYEVAFRSKAVWVPRGYDGVAAIWDEELTWGKASYGQHGGLSLAEAICPAFLLAPEGLASSRPGEVDEDLATVARYEPGWWNLDIVEPGERRAVAEVKDKQPVAKQVDLFAPVTNEVDKTLPKRMSIEPAEVPLHPVAEALSKNDLYKAQAEGLPVARRAGVLRYLSILLDAGDQMSFADFARRSGVPGFRVDGPIAELEILLNVDGYAVVERDRVGKQVRLHRARLEQIFEVRS